MNGLHVARIPYPDGKERHVIVRLEPVNGGAMYEYHDPLSDQVVGSVGGNRVDEFVVPLSKWIKRRIDEVREAVELAEREAA